MITGSRISGVAAVLPSGRLSTAEVEQQLDAQRLAGWRVPVGMIERLTGVRYRHVAPPGENASDLAAAAAGKLLAGTGTAIADVDLLIFASASQDMMEPATSHMVSARLGARCPVFDVKNACNSVLNGIQVADALIRTGAHRRVLVVTGETPSRAVRWRIGSREQFVESLPGYTLSDGGAALLLEPAARGPAAARTPGGRVEYQRF
jgi:3-oxoacyl-[acyl-carrier-protein] synthase III